MDIIKSLFTFNANKRLTTEQVVKHEFFKVIKDLVEAGFPLFLKLKEDGFKNIEINKEKIKLVKIKI